MIVRAVLLTLCLAVQVHADTVWLQPMPPTKTQSDWYPRSIEVIAGDVIDFDAKRLRITIDGDDVESIYAGWRVIWIEPSDASGLQSEAIALFDAGRNAECLSKLPAVLEERPPVWRQQWLTMMAASAAMKSSRGDIALELVSQIDRRSHPLLVTSWFPIAWRNGVQPVAIVQAARKRLQDPSPAVRLVAASWLLSSADRGEAAATLKTLAGQTDRREIAMLAKCVLWRTATPPDVVASMRSWHQELKRLPIALQTGPMQTMADKFESAGKPDAAKAWKLALELTPIHPHPF